MVRSRYRLMVAAGLVLAAGAVWEARGEPDSSEEAPIRTSLCELSSTPERFQGKLVAVRAVIQVGLQTSLLRDESCSVFMWVSGIDLESANPTLRKDPEFLKMREYLDKKYKAKDGSACARCAMYKVTATVLGRFEHAAKGEAGFGYMNSYDSRVVVQGVANIVAEEIRRGK